MNSFSNTAAPHANKDQGQISPLTRWLNENEKDEPWRGFSVASTERPYGQTRDKTTKNKSDTWSTQAEAGSAKGE
ncbi:hypothetical protein ACLX1H_008092 [Fusarium chlamydosporum]